MKKIVYCSLVLLAFMSCKNITKNSKETPSESAEVSLNAHSIKVQGHRGERAHSPENTIIGFKRAILKGVDVVELDVVMSQDYQVVVSHEPYMSSAYVLTPSGDSIHKMNEKQYNLYNMPYDSIRQYDVGSKLNSRFPEQQLQTAYKPLLAEVIDSLEHFIKQNHLKPVGYNIEIKSNPDVYDIYQPRPEKFVEVVMAAMHSKTIAGSYNIQSFDPFILEEMHKRYPKVPLAFLVSDGPFQEHLNQLSFVPQIYSPNYKLLEDIDDVKAVQDKGMQVIPWTVNAPESIKKMIDLQVNGIITDYPERVISALKR